MDTQTEGQAQSNKTTSTVFKVGGITKQIQKRKEIRQ